MRILHLLIGTIPKLFNVALALLILLVLAAPGLAYQQGGRPSSNVPPGTRFGGQQQDPNPPPYRHPVDPEERQRIEIEAPPGEPAGDKAPESEKPAPRKVRRPAKMIEVK